MKTPTVFDKWDNTTFCSENEDEIRVNEVKRAHRNNAETYLLLIDTI
jgi:hypothetical protein